MHQDVFPYYERELSYLRRFGEEFAARYPDVASALRLEPGRCDDPHVERLLEGFALLAGRVRRKLDDEFPEVAESLLSLLYPHYLAPVPPLGIAQFQVDPQAAKLTGRHEIPSGTLLHSRPVEGTTCRFRTCYPVTLWPVRVRGASISRWEEHVTPEPGASWRARALLRVELETLGGVRFDEIGIDSLRFFLHGEPVTTHGLHEILGGDVVRMEVRPTTGVGGGDESGDAENAGRFLPAEGVQAVGLGADDEVIPYPVRSFPGYRLLQELFVFPEKFLFYDIDLGDAPRATRCGRTLEIRLFLRRMPEFWREVEGRNLQLGSTPIINLFERQAEPISVDPTRMEYVVVPEVGRSRAYEVYSVDDVSATEVDTGRTRTVEPFYAFRHALRPDTEFCWTTRREPALDGATDTWLSLVDLGNRPRSASGHTLSLRLRCTNRDLVEQIPYPGAPRGDFDPEKTARFGPIVALVKPGPTIRTPMGREDEHWSASKADRHWRGGHWRLISHLALNYLSLEEGGLEALRSILQLYDYRESDATESMIRSIRSLRTTPLQRIFGGALCRGLGVDIELDESHFAGTSYYLFTAVLDRFIALYASVNSFTRLKVISSRTKRVLTEWPPRAGDRPII